MTTVAFECRLYSPNVANRWHWAKRSRHNKQVHLATFAAMGKCRPPAIGRRRLEITIAHSRPFDPDNAHAACKPLIDSLRKLGWIENDTRELLELEIKETKSKEFEVWVRVGESL